MARITITLEDLAAGGYLLAADFAPEPGDDYDTPAQIAATYACEEDGS